MWNHRIWSINQTWENDFILTPKKKLSTISYNNSCLWWLCHNFCLHCLHLWLHLHLLSQMWSIIIFEGIFQGKHICVAKGSRSKLGRYVRIFKYMTFHLQHLLQITIQECYYVLSLKFEDYGGWIKELHWFLHSWTKMYF